MKLSLGEIAKLLGGRLIGSSDVQISGVSLLEKAVEGDIVCLFDKKNLAKISLFTPTAIVVSEDLGLDIPAVVVSNSLKSLSILLDTYSPPPNPLPVVSERASISDSAEVGDDVYIAPFVFIGERVKIGNRIALYPGVYVGDDVTIGDDTVIYANATINYKVSIGRKVTIHSGVSIGSDGFGFYPDENGVSRNIPQVGGVIIEDDVNIGANSCVDRGTIGDTIISRGTKLDNLVQVGHNSKVGANSVVAGLTGISGSVNIGSGARIGGNVGVADHVTIASNTTLAAKAGVIGDIREGGGVYAGFPSTPQSKWRKVQASLRHLPEIILKIRGQEKRIAKLENKKEEK